MLSEKAFQALAQDAKPGTYPALVMACKRFDINTPVRQAAFLAQCHHESAGFTRLEENLNYSAARLGEVFDKHFKDARERALYAHHPMAIASRVYANRNGNGDEKSIDGWRYRGRGFLQITGLDQYRRMAQLLNMDLVNNPDWLGLAPNAALSAAAWWQMERLNSWADRGDYRTISSLINRGNPTAPAEGQPERLALTERYGRAFA